MPQEQISASLVARDEIRLSDAEIQALIDVQPLGPSWKRGALRELLQHRAAMRRLEAWLKELEAEPRIGAFLVLAKEIKYRLTGVP